MLYEIKAARRMTASVRIHSRSLLWPVTHEDRLPRRFWHRVISAALQTLALLALFIPVAGPLVDHHYAQRSPHHAHAYLGSFAGDHDHASLAEPHAHGDADALPLDPGDAGATVSLPASGDWSPQSTRAPALLFLALPAALFPLAAGRFQRLAPPTLLPNDESFLPPPEKPPRAPVL